MTQNELAALLNACPAAGLQGLSDDADDPQPRAQHELTQAAVLIPIINRSTELMVLFTQRTAHLNDHAGQISFPGGRADEGDGDAVGTALRETQEEIGLARGKVEVLGRIPAYTTGSGFLVTPVVGWIEPPLLLTLHPSEVAEVFEVPLRFLMDPANHRIESALFRGRMRTYYAMPYQQRYIWGATAGMLVSLYRVLAGKRV